MLLSMGNHVCPLPLQHPIRGVDSCSHRSSDGALCHRLEYKQYKRSRNPVSIRRCYIASPLWRELVLNTLHWSLLRRTGDHNCPLGYILPDTSELELELELNKDILLFVIRFRLQHSLELTP